MTILLSQSLWTGLLSIAQECIVFIVFFATWSLTRSYRQSKVVDPEKQAEGDLGKRAKAIQDLCAEQFTRAIRKYRDLVKHGIDKGITDEAFFTTLVEAALRCGKTDVATEIIQRMVANGLVPSSAFLLSVLKMLATRKNFAGCLKVYHLFGLGPTPSPTVFSCLVLAATEVGDLALARRVVDEQLLMSREALPLMRAYARTENWEACVDLVRCPLARAAPVENIMLNTALAACAQAAEALPVMQGLLDEVAVFEKEKHIKIADIVSYNTLLKAYAQHRDAKDCFGLLDTIFERSVPDGVTFSTLLDACIDKPDLAAVALERMTQCGVQMTCVVMTTLMNREVKCKRLDKAMQLYKTMRAANAKTKPDMITYSLLIKAHCDAQDMDAALRILEDMLESECCVDDVVFTHLIEGCCQVSSVELAEKLFADMRRAGIKPSIYTLTGLVKVYGKCGQSCKALNLVQRMEKDYGVKPTVVIVTCVVSGLLRQKKYDEAWCTFNELRQSVSVDAYCIGTLLVGLADGQRWTEFLELAAQSLRATPGLPAQKAARPSAGRPATLPECLNYGLNAMLTRGVAEGEVLQQLLAEQGVDATVAVTKRLA